MLTGPPETHYHPTVTEVAFRVRDLPVGPVAGTPLYINPSVAGFFNIQVGNPDQHDVDTAKCLVIAQDVVLRRTTQISSAKWCGV